MSDNGGMRGYARRGTTEDIKNTPASMWAIIVNLLKAAPLFALLGALGFIIVGWWAVYLGCIAVMLAFAGGAVYAAINTPSKGWRVSFIAACIISLAAVVIMAVSYENVRSLWPVPEIVAEEFPAVPEFRYTACGNEVCRNGYPMAGVTQTVELYGRQFVARDDTLWIDGTPSPPFEVGGGETEVIVSVDGAPLRFLSKPIVWNGDFIIMWRRMRGAVAILSVAAVVAILLMNTGLLTLVAASISETINKNSPPTQQQAPWFAPPQLWFAALFIPKIGAALLRASLAAMGGNEEPQGGASRSTSRVVGQDGTQVLGADGVWHKIRVVLMPREYRAVQEHLLATGGLNVRALNDVLGDDGRASTLRVELFNIGILTQPKARTMSKFTADGRATVAQW